MDIEILNTFLEVVTRGSFVGAAERMGVSQAAVSVRIQALESQFRPEIRSIVVAVA